MPSIGISVLDGVLFPEVPDVHLDFRLRSETPALTLSDALQTHLLKSLGQFSGLLDQGIDHRLLLFEQRLAIRAVGRDLRNIQEPSMVVQSPGFRQEQFAGR